MLTPWFNFVPGQIVEFRYSKLISHKVVDQLRNNCQYMVLYTDNETSVHLLKVWKDAELYIPSSFITFQRSMLQPSPEKTLL